MPFNFEEKLAMLKHAAPGGRTYHTGLQGDAARAQQGEGAMGRIQGLVGKLQGGGQKAPAAGGLQTGGVTMPKGQGGGHRGGSSFYGANKGPNKEKVVRAETGTPTNGRGVNPGRNTPVNKMDIAKDTVRGTVNDISKGLGAVSGFAGRVGGAALGPIADRMANNTARAKYEGPGPGLPQNPSFLQAAMTGRKYDPKPTAPTAAPAVAKNEGRRPSYSATDATSNPASSAVVGQGRRGGGTAVARR